MDLTIQGPIPGHDGKHALVIRLKCLLILQIFGGHIKCINPFCGATDTPVLVNSGEICLRFKRQIGSTRLRNLSLLRDGPQIIISTFSESFIFDILAFKIHRRECSLKNSNNANVEIQLMSKINVDLNLEGYFINLKIILR